MAHECEAANSKEAEKPLAQAKSYHVQELNQCPFRMPFDHVTVANRQTLAVSIVFEMHSQKLDQSELKNSPIRCLEFQESFKKSLISLRMLPITSTAQFS